MKEKIDCKYVVQKSNSFEYFIYKDEVFVFPDFNEIKYNEELKRWEVIYRKRKEETIYSLDEFFDQKKQLFEEKINLPIRLLISRDYFGDVILDLANLPNNLFVMRYYNAAFDDEKNKSLYLAPQNTKQLYEMMVNNDKLGGKIELSDDELIIWTFDEVIYEISIDVSEGYFDVTKNNKFRTSITHWHPESYQLYEDICNIGEKGNVLVIKTFLGSAKVLYMGSAEKCPYKKNRMHFAKYYFFESK